MLLVPCPHCGPRNADELRYLGEPSARPDPNDTTPERWRRYLYMRRNEAGWRTERWYCRSGCRRFFLLERNTVTNEMRAAGGGR